MDTEAAPIAREEYVDRQERLRAVLAREGYDGALVWGRGSTNVDGCADLLYLTGHLSAVSHILDSEAHSARGHAGLVVPLDRPTTLVTDSYDADPAALAADEVLLSTSVDRDLATVARDAGLTGKRIALIGMSGLLHTHYRRLADGLGATELVPADEILVGLRLVKSEHEIALLREASRIGCEWVMRTLAAAVPGATEGEAVGEGLRYLSSVGGWAYDVAVSSGPDSHRYRNRQALPTWDAQRRLEPGDLFHADVWGPIAHGYFCDLTRSTVVGATPTASQARTLGDAVDLVEHVTEIVEPGVRMSALQDRASSWLARRDGGGGSNFAAMVPFVGHSLGLECEAPFMTRLEHMPIAPGMVLAVECFLGGEPGEGAGFEHVVVVREDRLEVLTSPAPSRPWS
ncbi:M24 family metallopeptidase [Amycolatopsis jejuensis]|uniref:M24 family metallopeptidase n=1 Tax=Amycolatopsis jejuensis TaxID=330084 RepID=UPI0012E02506|nr:M24 family metallopeptidase [Amycolatopsis jejuensis]